MKRKHILGTVIPTFMMSAVIASGYCIWHFNDISTKKEESYSMDVTQEVKIGNITASSDFSIEFDQTIDGRKATYGKDDTDVLSANGISLKWGGTPTKVATYTSPSDTKVTDKPTDYNVYFDVVIDFGSNSVTTSSTALSGKKLSDIISVSYNSTALSAITNNTTNGNGYYYTQSTNSATSMSFDWSNVTISYVTEPKNSSELDELRTLIKDKKFKVTYYGYIAKNATAY